MGTSGLILLSHQGFSFIEDLSRIARKLQLKVFILSSKPTPGNESRIETLQELADVFTVTDEHSLKSEDLEKFIEQLKGSSTLPLATVSVWEGYRALMANGNAMLGATDITQDQVLRLLDKLNLRTTLRENGLSRVDAEILTEKAINKYDFSKIKKFIKPRFGLGSFATFKAKEGISYKEILELKKTMETDLEYKSVFDRSTDFILEDYINGIEASYEIIVQNGKANALAIHEKLSLEAEKYSVLEVVSVAPPVTISVNQQRAGFEFISKCLKALNIQSGCFHIEVKFTGQRWEIIEMNPRVGGALIKESVNLVSGGKDLLELWIRTLLDLPIQLPKDGLPMIECGTYFRVYFGSPGRKIKEIKINEFGQEILKVSAKVGQLLPNSSKEIFLGQALWKLKRENFDSQIREINQISKQAVEVTYE